MAKMICFDMDGTLCDFYAANDWLACIEKEDASVYENAKPLWNMDELRDVLLKLESQGWEIRVISWLAKNSSEKYKTAVRKAKREWLKRYNFPCKHTHLVEYGTTKANVIRKLADSAVLVDDNAKIRNGWSLGMTIDPADGDLIERLRDLVVDGQTSATGFLIPIDTWRRLGRKSGRRASGRCAPQIISQPVPVVKSKFAQKLASKNYPDLCILPIDFCQYSWYNSKCQEGKRESPLSEKNFKKLKKTLDKNRDLWYNSKCQEGKQEFFQTEKISKKVKKGLDKRHGLWYNTNRK